MPDIFDRGGPSYGQVMPCPKLSFVCKKKNKEKYPQKIPGHIAQIQKETIKKTFEKISVKLTGFSTPKFKIKISVCGKKQF